MELLLRAEGNELINGQIEKQIKGQTQTALLYKASEIGKGYTLAHIEKTQKNLKYNSITPAAGRVKIPFSPFLIKLLFSFG